MNEQDIRQSTSPILIPDSQWPALRQRSQSPAFAAAMHQLRRDVETFLAQPLTVPELPGGYYHDYFCPEHGVELLFDAASPTEHRCPVDGAVIRGDRFNAAWRWFVNNRLAEGALRLAVLWRLEDHPPYLTRVAEILNGYAARYADYRDVPRSSPRPGIATFQTLDESVWILPLAWAFDLVRAGLSPEERASIAGQLLTQAAEFLVENHFGGIHNFACWHNAAIGTLGLVLGRQDLVDFAIHGAFGFDTQVREGVLADGLWFEGSFSYHFYTLAALLMLAKATCHMPDLDLRDRPALHAMLEAPVLCAFPDGSLPATNDCWYFTSLVADCCHGVPPAPAFYEIGYAWYADPRFAQVLNRAYQHGPRNTLDALLFGPETIPPAAVDPLPSVHLPASGYAILRSPRPAETFPISTEDQRYLFLKYGPHGGGHGHPDKLNLMVYAHDHRLSVDLGTPGYGLDLFQTWYRQTISHNTLAVDGRSQPPAEGESRAFRGEGPCQVADAAVAWDEGSYAGVNMRRVILARPDYFLDICLVECDRPRRIDWIYHNVGELQTLLDFERVESLDGAGDGYEHIADVRRATTAEDVVVNWTADGTGLRLFLAGAPDTAVVVGSSPGNPPTDLRSVVIQQRQATATAYLAVFHPHGSAAQVAAVRWMGRDLLKAGWAGCVVEHAAGLEGWLISLSPDVDIPPGLIPDDVSATFTYCLATGLVNEGG